MAVDRGYEVRNPTCPLHIDATNTKPIIRLGVERSLVGTYPEHGRPQWAISTLADRFGRRVGRGHLAISQRSVREVAGDAPSPGAVSRSRRGRPLGGSEAEDGAGRYGGGRGLRRDGRAARAREAGTWMAPGEA